VLVPRPETEQLVDAALKCFKNGRALDLGTGSGNIAIALAKFVPQSRIVGVDISAQALELAIFNAKQHSVLDRIQFIYDDFLVILKQKPEDPYDLIISNPPYIPTSQLSTLPKDVQKEPVIALHGGTDGLNFFRVIIKYSHLLLRSGGCLMMEFGDGQAQAVKKLMEDQSIFVSIEIIKDLAGRDRIIKAIR
jgi:release factor glutamine methyltransferase